MLAPSGARRARAGTYWLFTGEQRDSESAYYYLRARYYDPALGRFLGRDPLGGGYPYVSNNPVNLIDPTGLYQICTSGICFDSTEVGLPADMPNSCDISANLCYWKLENALFVASYVNYNKGETVSVFGTVTLIGGGRILPDEIGIVSNNDLLVSASFVGQFTGAGLDWMLVSWSADNGWVVDTVDVQRSFGGILVNVKAHTRFPPFAGTNAIVSFYAKSSDTGNCEAIVFHNVNARLLARAISWTVDAQESQACHLI
jgi:RHS repeat-associated protein